MSGYQSANAGWRGIMKRFHQILPSGKFGWVLVPVVLLLFVPKSVQATTTWTVALGAQSSDASRQAMAFLPNEIWIDAGDSVTWTSNVGEAHTVSFLQQPETAATPGNFPTTAVSRPNFQASRAGDPLGVLPIIREEAALPRREQYRR
jgi:plastocyanin